MNIQQLEYIVAIDNHRHFARAAAECFVTQPTLSMMVHKLEEELGCKIFDRSKQPVVPTEIGQLVIGQARIILREVRRLPELLAATRQDISGELRIGIIPTLAPYLVPLFLESFLTQYPEVHLSITENLTHSLVEALRKGQLDALVAATPLHDDRLKEHFLFHETFWVYTQNAYAKTYLVPEDIDLSQLWLLEEGHCLRSSILNLCELRKSNARQLTYETGSLETLKRLVETQRGTTILPKLATLSMDATQQALLKPFEPPMPARTIALITHRDHLKHRLIEVFTATLLKNLPPELLAESQEVRVF